MRGGTEGSFAPPASHTQLVLAPLLARRMGADVDLQIEHRGFVDGGPLGELRVRARLPPSGTLQPLELVERGAPRGVVGVVAAPSGGTAAADAVVAALRPALEQLTCVQGAAVTLEAQASAPAADGGRKGKGRGSGKFICSVQLAVTTDTGCVLSANASAAVTADGISVTHLVDSLCRQLETLIASGACACEHTTDQLVAYMALAAGTSRLKGPPAAALTSQHLPTVLHFAALLTGATFRVSVASDGCQVIECDGVGAKAAEPPPVGES